MKKLFAAIFASALALDAFAIFDALKERIEKAQEELNELVAATKSGTRWYLSNWQYEAITNRLAELSEKSVKYAEKLEKDEDGRRLVHGKVAAQTVDLSRGVEILTYLDGWAHTNKVKVKKVESLAERTARLVAAAAEAAKKAKEAEERRRADLPRDYAATLERRDAAAATTNEVTVTAGN